jgi:hypothetical protein
MAERKSGLRSWPSCRNVERNGHGRSTYGLEDVR